MGGIIKEAMMSNIITIDQQKQIADEVLEKIELICPRAIIAGGAPRDWYFGTPSNDIDLYFSTQGDTQGVLLSQLSKLFKGSEFDLKFEWSKEKEEERQCTYKVMKTLRRIIDFEYKGVKFQLMEMNTLQDLFKVVDSFSTSICKVWYKGGQIKRTQDFRLTEKTKIMFLNEDYEWSDPHPAKMKERFPSYTRGTKESAEKHMINRVLQEL
jgi:hypothetical protein